MKTISLFLISLLLVASIPCIAAISYSITFAGSGASTNVGDVVVQNLTKNTTVTVLAGNTLNLSDVISAVDQINTNDETIRVYPNSVGGTSTLSIFTKQAGNTQINVYSLDGRKVVSMKQDIEAGSNSFQLSLPSGSYAIQAVGNGYTYTTKIINQRSSQSNHEIAYVGAEKPMSSVLQKSKSYALGTTLMLYNTGDRLLYKGTSGKYSSVVTDVPSSSKTINFDFAACTDGDGNNYKVVKIGTQTWMAENLKTTKYNDGTSIPNISDNTAWTNLSTPAYCWYNNDASTYKNTYGALYNWYTINIAKLAPVGWHIPTNAECTILDNYLITNGYNYDGSTTYNYYAKSLAATTNWTTYSGTGTIGDNLTKNNSTGFSSLPSGGRNYWGTYGNLNNSCMWWSATEVGIYAWYRSLGFNSSSVGNNYYTEKQNGYSVRCVRD
jgi:uncharacterized protein (TIGR02145 family)